MILTLSVLRRLTKGMPADTRVRVIAGRPSKTEWTKYRVYCDPTAADTTRYWISRPKNYSTPRVVIYAEHLSHDEWFFRARTQPSNRLRAATAPKPPRRIK